MALAIPVTRIRAGSGAATARCVIRDRRQVVAASRNDGLTGRIP
jgi:hypothetical protein